MCLPHRNELLQRIDSMFQKILQRSRQSPPAALTRDIISTATQCPSGALGCCGAFCGSWRCGSSAGQSPSSSPGSTSSCYRSPPASTPSRACAKPSSNCCSCRWRAPRTWWRWSHAALSCALTVLLAYGIQHETMNRDERIDTTSVVVMRHSYTAARATAWLAFLTHTCKAGAFFLGTEFWADTNQ